MEISERPKDMKEKNKLWKERTLKEECLTTLKMQDKEDIQCVDSDLSKYMT